MRIDVYQGDTLAATFDYGQPPSYYGEAGRRVRALVARPHCVRNLWTGEAAYAPPAGRPDWWAATILSAGLRRRASLCACVRPWCSPPAPQRHARRIAARRTRPTGAITACEPDAMAL